MSVLGQKLREARLAQQLTVADVEAAIKIRARQIVALEEGDSAALPPPVYARGLVRKYAEFLGVDPFEMMVQYDQEFGAAPPATIKPVLEEPLYRRGRDWSELLLGAGVLLLLLVAGALVWQYSILPLRQAPPAQVVAASTAVPTQALAVAATVTATTAPPTRTPVLEATPQGGPAPTATLLPTVGPTATREPPTPAPTVPSSEVEVAVEITQPSWIRVTVDGEQVFTSILQPGQSRAWRGKTSVNLRTGNAGGTIIFINGQPMGTLGTPGAVVEREWQVAQGDIIMLTPGGQPQPIATKSP